jgi:hypothetical protein
MDRCFSNVYPSPRHDARRRRRLAALLPSALTLFYLACIFNYIYIEPRRKGTHFFLLQGLSGRISFTVAEEYQGGRTRGLTG